MKPYDCCLTLSFPSVLEDNILGRLLEHPEWAEGFSTARIEGHGRAGTAHAAAELVRGRAARLQVQIVLSREDAHALLADLREALPSAEIAYWVTPVLDFGRLG